jgi:hypothetical protein
LSSWFNFFKHFFYECNVIISCGIKILAKLATVRRKAKLDADLSILCHQKDVAAAEAEVNALRSSVDNESITEFNNQKEHEIFVCDSIIFCRLDSIFSNISSMSVMLLSVAALNASYSVRESSVLVWSRNSLVK